MRHVDAVAGPAGDPDLQLAHVGASGTGGEGAVPRVALVGEGRSRCEVESHEAGEGDQECRERGTQSRHGAVLPVERTPDASATPATLSRARPPGKPLSGERDGTTGRGTPPAATRASRARRGRAARSPRPAATGSASSPEADSPTSPDAASSPSKSSSDSAFGSSAAMNSTTPGSTATGPAATAAATASPSAARNSSTCGSVPALTERWIVGGCPAKDICGWTYQPARGHLVADRERVAGAVGRERDQRRVGRYDDVEPGQVGHARDDPVHRREHVPGQREVAVVAERLHHRPGPGERPAGLRRLHRRVEHRVARPLRATRRTAADAAPGPGAATATCPSGRRRTCGGPPRSR